MFKIPKYLKEIWLLYIQFNNELTPPSRFELLSLLVFVFFGTAFKFLLLYNIIIFPLWAMATIGKFYFTSFLSLRLYTNYNEINVLIETLPIMNSDVASLSYSIFFMMKFKIIGTGAGIFGAVLLQNQHLSDMKEKAALEVKIKVQDVNINNLRSELKAEDQKHISVMRSHDNTVQKFLAENSKTSKK